MSTGIPRLTQIQASWLHWISCAKARNGDFRWNDFSLLQASLRKSAPTQECQFCHGCGQLYGSAAGFPGIPLGPKLWVSAGVRKTLTSCQQNPILFGQAGLTTPTRLGFLFRLTFSVTSQCNGNYDSNTKCKGHWYGFDGSSRCQSHRDYDAINSIITQKQLYLTRKQWGPPEWFRESIRLDKHGWWFNWQSVGKEQHPDPGGTFYSGSWRHNAFYVMMLAMSFRTFELTLWAPQM